MNPLRPSIRMGENIAGALVAHGLGQGDPLGMLAHPARQGRTGAASEYRRKRGLRDQRERLFALRYHDSGHAQVGMVRAVQRALMLAPRAIACRA